MKRRRHSRIQTGRDTVVKTADPERMRVEVEKTRRALEIGRQSGLFRVPEVLDYDEKEGVVVLERIRGLRPVRNGLLARGRTALELAARSARALAAIHRDLRLPEDMRVNLPPELAAPGARVFLHGDFNGANVCRSETEPGLVILDWQMTSRHGGRATCGTRFFDVVWFLNYLLWTPGWRHLVGDPVAPVARVFLATYFHETAAGDEAELGSYAQRFFEHKQARRRELATWWQRPWLPRCQVITRRFLEGLVRKASA